MATGHLESLEARDTLILGTPIRQAAPGALQFGSPWRTGPSTPLSAQLWRSIEPEQTPDQPIVNGYSCGGSLPRMHITVPERLPPDRTVRFDHNGTTYSVIIPQDYSPGSRVEVELTAANPAPMNLAAHHGLESPVAKDDTMSVLRIRRDVHRFREDLRSYNGVKAHLRHQLELLEEESQLIDACLTSKAEIKRLSEELQASEQEVRTKKEKALAATSPSKSTPSSRPEAERPAGGQDSVRGISALGSASSQRFVDEANISATTDNSSELEAAKILADEEEKTEAAIESEVDVLLCDKPEKIVELLPVDEKSEAVVPRDSISPPKTREPPRTIAPPQLISSPQMRPSQPAVILPGPTRTTPRVVTRDLLSTAPIRPPLTMPAPVPSATSKMPSMMPPPMIGPPGGMPRPLGTGGGASASFSQQTNQTTAVRRESKQAWEIQQERRQPGVAMPPPRTMPMVRSDVATSNAMMRQSSETPAVTAQSKVQVKSPRLTTRPDCLGPVCPVPGPRNDASQGVHPARSTLHICRPSGSVAVKPTGSATEGNRVRTSSPGFRRDQSYRTTLPANLPNSTNSTSISPRGSVVNTNRPGVSNRAVQWNVDGRTSRIR